MAASTSPIPGGTVLATVSADPNYQVNKLLGLAQAVGGAMRNAQARRDQERERELREIEGFYTMALKYPELASTMGPQLKAKYGSKYPQVGGLVDVLNNRQAEAQGIRQAGERFYEVQGTMERKYAADQAAVASMPDAVLVPVPSFGSGAPVGMPFPNVEKAQRAAALSQIQPAAFPLVAERALSPKEREQARLAGAIQHQRFDPFKDLPPDQKADLARILGWLVGDAGENAEVGMGRRPSRAKLQEQDFSRTERVESEKEKERQAIGEDERTADQARLTDRLVRGRMGMGEDIQERLIDRRAARTAEREGGKGKGDGGGNLWREAQDESKVYVEEWDEGLKRATAGLEGRDKTKAVAEYKKANPFPARVSAEGAQSIAARVQQRVQQGVVSKGEASATVARLVESYHRRLREGMKPSEALRAVLKREEELASGGGGMN